jgi:crotonobetainyl-CoA:carnitine CoA-transferase CaiB-like acyl-CoA transferase
VITDAAEYAERLLGGLGVDLPVLAHEAPSDPVRDWAGSGAMWLTGYAGEAPQLGAGTPATAVHGALLALRSVAAAVGVDASQLPDERLLGERAALVGLTRNGRTSAGGATRLLEAADGTVAIALARETDLASLPALTEAAVTDQPWDAVAEWCSRTSVADVAERAALLGIAAAALPTAGSTEVGPQPMPAVALHERPLTVVDLSALWAGPLAAHLLQLVGARVVGVESPTRPDPSRLSQPAFFDLLHSGTEQRSLDFTTADGRDELRRLIAAADIVIEASRPRGLQQLGIDAEQLASDHGITWVSITAYGRDDPRIGFGDDVAVGAGLVGAGPVFAGDAIADPITGVHAALIALTRALSGRTGVVEVPMHDTVQRCVGPVPDAEVVQRDGDWYVDTGNDLIAVARPSTRVAS